MGKSSAILAPRKLQRRSLVDHETFRELSRYSPSGSDVVAGNARHARKTANRKMSRGPCVRSFKETHKKLSSDPSSVGAVIWPFWRHRSCASADATCATTNPARSE